MITRERLEELIQQSADIYMARYYTEGIHLEPENFEANYKELVFKYKIYAVLLEDLFETKEEAEWYKEFGNITRTETLELPTWEEFHGKTYYNKHYGIIFQGKASGCTYQMYEELTPENIIIYDTDCQDIVFSKPPTKENYTLACRKCRELFLGKGE